MTPDELRSLGEGHFGSRWQTALARVLGIDSRSVRRYASGSFSIPSWVHLHLKMLEEMSDLLAEGSGSDGVFKFRNAGKNYFPCRHDPSIVINSVPDHATALRTLSKFLRKPRDPGRKFFDWSDL